MSNLGITDVEISASPSEKKYGKYGGNEVRWVYLCFNKVDVWNEWDFGNESGRCIEDPTF